jgi:dipeptide/tripeptide permease
MMSAITLYLSCILGFNDIQATTIAGVFSTCLYLLPIFTGALADKIGFRSSMLLAFSLLTAGYAGLGAFPTLLESAGFAKYSMTTKFTGLTESNIRYAIIPIMTLIVVGGSFIKSVISGTVAKETTPENRAKGFSLFYSTVNIGAFSEKTIAEPVRTAMGNEGLIILNYFSATMTFLALIAVFFLYKTRNIPAKASLSARYGMPLQTSAQTDDCSCSSSSSRDSGWFSTNCMRPCRSTCSAWRVKRRRRRGTQT